MKLLGGLRQFQSFTNSDPIASADTLVVGMAVARKQESIKSE